uniref:Uncharacterized protein n=1 Tax=Nephromyces sp. ex Molgula occidentalis TaxID=2544991 RepID=A0A5C1H828_9APIC|nr:hypothetical protein [Nephromyces sp. ex Molgula occidentalis]
MLLFNFKSFKKKVLNYWKFKIINFWLYLYLFNYLCFYYKVININFKNNFIYL